MFRIEVEREEDGCWLGEVPTLPGALAYGATATEARTRASALALRILANPCRIDPGAAAGGAAEPADRLRLHHPAAEIADTQTVSDMLPVGSAVAPSGLPSAIRITAAA